MGSDDPAPGDWLVLYGSLMRGLGAMDRLGVGGGLRFVGPCTCTGALFDLGDHPGLCRGQDRIVAELYAILDPSVVETLDAFEDYVPGRPDDSLYLRERTRLVEPAGTIAWIYRYNQTPPARRRVASGDWRAHLEERDRVPDEPDRRRVD